MMRDVATIRLRRIPRRFLWRRRYEIEFPSSSGAGMDQVITSAPMTKLDPWLGVGDAWALVHSADRAWDGQVGEWVTLFEGSSP